MEPCEGCPEGKGRLATQSTLRALELHALGARPPGAVHNMRVGVCVWLIMDVNHLLQEVFTVCAAPLGTEVTYSMQLGMCGWRRVGAPTSGGGQDAGAARAAARSCRECEGGGVGCVESSPFPAKI